jgi:O-antigen/teichoic acid export membrane protein
MTKINRITKVFMPFGKSGNIYLFGALGQGLGPVVLTPILTRILDVKSYGEITFITSFAAILGILFSLGLPIVISRSYVLEVESRPSITRWFKQITISYLLLSAVLITFAGNNLNLFILAVAFPFAAMQLILPLARAQDKASQFAFISVIGTLLPSIGVVLNNSIDSPISNPGALGLGAIIGAFISFVLVSAKNNSTLRLSKYSLSNSIKIGYSILPHMLAMVALLNIDKVIFGNQLDKTFSGYLQVIMLVGTAPILILSALNHAWLNQILLQLKSNSKKAFADLNQTIIKLFILILILVGTINVLSTQIINLLNPNLLVNSEVQKTVILTSVVSFIYVVYLANTHLLTWQKKFWVLGVTTPASVVLQSVIIYLSLNSLGYLSAAIGFGSALTLQVLLLEISRSKTETKGAINRWYLTGSISLFWLFAALFLI